VHDSALCELFSLFVPPLRKIANFICLEGYSLESLHFLQCSKLSVGNICRVRDHGFHDFLSHFKRDLVFGLNFWLSDVVLVSGVNATS
jgi:hypothetical protein